MSNNVLSQSEIDALLNALASGEDTTVSEPEPEPEQSVRTYDFRTANKFYKEQMRTLNVIFDNFSFLLANRLTAMLHTLCEVEVLSIEEQKFSEFNNSIATPSFLNVIELKPLQGSIVMNMGATVAYAVVSRLFGGAADYGEESKAFTEIELTILENVSREIMFVMKEAWGKIVEVKPKVARVETNPQFTQITDANEPSAIIMMDVKIDKIQGMLSICIPHYAIQPVAKELNTISWTMAASDRQGAFASQRDVLERQIDETEVTLTATFHDTDATLEDILSLRIGDSILLNHNIKDYITIYVEDKPKFKGVVGISKNKYVVQVAKITKESEEIE